jgi:hypothetical protein
MLLGSLEPKQFLSKIVGQSWIFVKENRMMNAMKFKYIIHEILIHYGCGESIEGN